MIGAERREATRQILSTSGNPVSGSVLAKHFQVSRQVVVQDIAILRAGGADIIATSQGYYIPDLQSAKKIQFTIACRHGAQDMAKELEIIVDCGGKVLDVIVEHPVYGELRGMLMLASRRDVQRFVESNTRSGAEPLSVLTQGVHLHTIEVPDEESKRCVLDGLKEAGMLLNC